MALSNDSNLHHERRYVSTASAVHSHSEKVTDVAVQHTPVLASLG